ncbi:hypothetical protein Xen7305DRAFT_00051360 [Xenococcus sp. PCC 7305]|uniref:hypothetical protein n=1 Tax=Xenococcus sp. PCC 7305 TaxID=102125 RepID=UPI0002ACD995|nr:hypothetical protein [Xenococcus sp. PCC 7305]ELS05393.1 hypothetical protein Xen7305DRAFT_00051360 [Xenococcus sp. PCC 7305]
MKVIETVRGMVNYLAEGFLRLFGPTNDEYPEIGIQPFEGEVYNPSSSADW